MNIKIPFLLFIFSITLFSCNAHQISTGIKSPPVDYFVKIFKEIEITRCPKNNPDKKKCEKKGFVSTGSGLIIKISESKRVVLSAGHVCRDFSILEEDREFNYHWVETVMLMDRDKGLHQGHVILAKPGDASTPDLCTLFSPTLESRFKIKSNIRLSYRPPKIGEDIYYIGAPRGIFHPPTSLIIKGVFSGNIDRFTALTSAPAAPGSSGSVVLSMNNRVYGVLFAVHPQFPVASVITSHEETKNFIYETLLLLR